MNSFFFNFLFVSPRRVMFGFHDMLVSHGQSYLLLIFPSHRIGILIGVIIRLRGVRYSSSIEVEQKPAGGKREQSPQLEGMAEMFGGD
jgi:hypothetical protein